VIASPSLQKAASDRWTPHLAASQATFVLGLKIAAIAGVENRDIRPSAHRQRNEKPSTCDLSTPKTYLPLEPRETPFNTACPMGERELIREDSYLPENRRR
jgi:hypothetical protein